MRYIFFIFIFFLFGCREEKSTPFSILSEQQIENLSPSEKTCYLIAKTINTVFTESPTHCTTIKEKGNGIFKENYSFHLKTSTKKAAEWHKWACLAAGKVMNDGAAVGMDKIYLKSKASDKYSMKINAHFCRDIQRKAYSGQLSEFEVLKEFNRRSSPEQI